MALAAEAQLDPAVDHPLAVQAVRDAGLRQHVDGALLEHARAHAVLDVLARAGLQHDAVDPLAPEQVGEQQAGGPGPDDADLGVHQLPPRAIVRARAAGTPGTSSASVIAISTISGTVQSPEASCTAPSSHGPVAATR